MLHANVKDRVSGDQPAPSSCRNLFSHEGHYVFDGNRVTARYRVGRNGVGRWRLWTVDSNLSLVVAADHRVRVYRRTGTTTDVSLVDEFGSVFDALRPLDDAVRNCTKFGHVWSPVQNSGEVICRWKWCLSCGEEELSSGRSLSEVVGMTPVAGSGTFPRLHGPIARKLQ